MAKHDEDMYNRYHVRSLFASGLMNSALRMMAIKSNAMQNQARIGRFRKSKYHRRKTSSLTDKDAIVREEIPPPESPEALEDDEEKEEETPLDASRNTLTSELFSSSPPSHTVFLIDDSIGIPNGTIEHYTFKI